MKKWNLLFIVIGLIVALGSSSYSDDNTAAITNPISDKLNAVIGGQVYENVISDGNGNVYVSINEISENMGYDYSIVNNVNVLKSSSDENEVLYTNGDIYIGQLKDGKRNGTGVMYYHTGSKYDGDWKLGYKSGYGREVDELFNVYTGQFDTGYRHGEGTLVYSNGDRFKGTWSFGFKNGKGIQWYSNGDRYDGFWIDGLYNGFGKRYIGGTVKQGLYIDGKYSKYMKDPENEED